ncbi:MAG: YitT family protein [Candidatus Shapirobacteria bacterium]
MKEPKSFIFSLVGFFFLALFINLFSWQFKLVTGGFPGFGLVLSYLLPQFSVGTILLVFNILILFAVLLVNGKGIALKSTMGFFIFPIMLDLIKNYSGIHQQLTPNLFISLILMAFSGVIFAASVALPFSQKYTIGGWGSLSLVAQKLIHISPPKFILLLDVITFTLTAIFIKLSTGLLFATNSLVFFFAFKYFLSFYNRRLNHTA